MQRKGKLVRTAAIRRDCIETCQAELVSLASMVEECAIRTRQAMRRSPLVGDVLSPAAERLEQMSQSVAMIQDEISAYWREQQCTRWTPPAK